MGIRRFWRGGSWSKISGRRRHSPPTICARLDRPVDALQLCGWKFSHKETLQQTFFGRSTLLEEMWSICVLSPFWGGGRLGATYAVHLRLIGKLVVDFLLVITELFLLGLRAEALRANIDLKWPFLMRTDQFAPKISGRRGRPHQPFFVSEN